MFVESSSISSVSRGSSPLILTPIGSWHYYANTFFSNYYVNESQSDVTEAIYSEYPGLRESIM